MSPEEQSLLDHGWHDRGDGTWTHPGWYHAYTGLAHEIERAASNCEDSKRLMERGR